MRVGLTSPAQFHDIRSESSVLAFTAGSSLFMENGYKSNEWILLRLNQRSSEVHRASSSHVNLSVSRPNSMTGQKALPIIGPRTPRERGLVIQLAKLPCVRNNQNWRPGGTIDLC